MRTGSGSSPATRWPGSHSASAGGCRATGPETVRPGDGATFAVLASHAAEALTVTPVLAGGQSLDRVTLDPFGIKVLTVSRR